MQTENRMGSFICEIRKKKNLTQRQLAEQLCVTDKAVSKWERGMGYPDITLLAKLAECLGVTTNELLSGVQEEVSAPEASSAPEALVQYTLEYADRVTLSKTARRLRFAAAVVSACLTLAAVICVICDLSLNGGRLTPPLTVIPVSSLLFAWLVVMPPLCFERQKLLMTLLSTSIFIFPFLMVLNQAVEGRWFFPVAVPCALASLAYAWVVVLTHSVTRGGMWYTGAAALLFIPLLDLSINLALHGYLGSPVMNGWDGITVFVCIVLAVVLFGIGRLRGRTRCIAN